MPEHDRDPKIHPYKFDSTKMPWHSDDKPFGWTQADWDTYCLDAMENEKCYCGLPGVYHMGRWYCQDCWDNGDDDE